MPELPEVETIVQDLRKKILYKKIVKVDICLKRIVKGSNSSFVKILTNQYIKEIKRRGKLLIFSLSVKDKYLIIHLKMTGQLVYKKGNKIIGGGHEESSTVSNVPNKYSHVRIYFKDKSALYYNDIRQFGFLKIISRKELDEYLDNYGVEPLSSNFTLAILKKLLDKRRGNLKAFLLNQHHIVGLGNIYVDESLFAAHILPTRKIDTLTSKEITSLFKAIVSILKRAVKARGTTFNNYVDADGNKGNFVNKLKVYQKDGELCSRCKKMIIEKMVVAGRGTRYCPSCQK